MSASICPLVEISRQVQEILIREIGVVDTLRFLSQFRSGGGDHKKERGQWLDELSLDGIVTGIKASRRKKRRTRGTDAPK